jgi:hypothetical protein
MTDKQIREQIERATTIVRTWPAWKRNALRTNSTRSSPREPVETNSHNTIEIQGEISNG